MEEEENAGLGLHWHVITGTRGYMPDSNEVYTDRDSAIAGAELRREWLQEDLDHENEYREEQGEESRATLTGSAAEGWIETDWGDVYRINHYIEVSECTDTSCDLEEHYW